MYFTDLCKCLRPYSLFQRRWLLRLWSLDTSWRTRSLTSCFCTPRGRRRWDPPPAELGTSRCEDLFSPTRLRLPACRHVLDEAVDGGDKWGWSCNGSLCLPGPLGKGWTRWRCRSNRGRGFGSPGGWWHLMEWRRWSPHHQCQKQGWCAHQEWVLRDEISQRQRRSSEQPLRFAGCLLGILHTRLVVVFCYDRRWQGAPKQQTSVQF